MSAERCLAWIVVAMSLLLFCGCDGDSHGTATATPTATITPTVTATSTATATPTSSATATPTPTPTPVPTSTATATPALPDLRPVHVVEVGCGTKDYGNSRCLYLILELCLENAGNRGAGASTARVDGFDLRIPALAAGEGHCEQFGAHFGEPDLILDSLHEVQESDESNNALSYPSPSGTRCDICFERSRPRPTPLPPSRRTEG